MAEMSKMSSFARLKLLTYLGYLILLTIYVLCLVISHIHAAPTCPRNVGINKVGFCLSNRSFYEWECMQCPHGLGQSIQCGRIYYELLKVHCVPCENGTSYSNSNDNGQCIKCKKCQENELKSGQCLPDKDTTKCVCKLGYYRDRGHCKPCSWCCGDKSNDHVEECKHLEKKCSYNAKSCDPTTTSAPTTTADPTTLAPKTTVPTAKQPRTEESQNKSYPFTNDSEKTVTPNDSKKTEKEHSGGKKSEKNGLVLQILLSFIVVVLIILLALVIYCCCKRRSNSSDGGSNENSSSTSNASSLAPLLDKKRDVNSNKSGEHVDLKPSDDSSATSHAKSK
ncbi:uncharacterized protein LOC116287904, partial [Actinia tenebrosa]|uniref:Uncharacterized protein LOC116287904 n=1 Tax=Actinia tenebrosa TaxID=6105 RepID=A0A6P8H4J4_ACTTE